MTSLKRAAAFVITMLLGQINTAAFASEGGLTYPVHVNDSVELRLNSVIGENIDYPELLQVYVGKPDACCTNRTPVAGQYEVDAGVVTFIPTFEFIEGQNYVVRVSQVGADDVVVHTLTEFNIQSDALALPAQVTTIFPSGTSLPENVLRFYIHFSKPMTPHVAFDYIKLVDANGDVDDAAFMRFKQELWSEDRKRLTLLMDPGRIKREVSTNLRLGPALRKGQHYTLVVEGGWPAANAGQVIARYEKPFQVSDALRKLPHVEQWAITAPLVDSKSALKIKFDRPFDSQLLQTDINIFSDTGLYIPGEITVHHSESAWHFQPYYKWTGKRIHIVVDSELEDVAGNNFKDLLDHVVGTEKKQIRQTSLAVDLRF